MDLFGKHVKVVSGYYKDANGVVKGSTVDGYWLVMPESKNGFWATSKELVVIE